MNDLLLAAADPAREVQPDPQSHEARQMLASIVGQPRPVRRPARRTRRVILGVALAGAAAVAAVVAVATMPWQATTPTTKPAAFTVTLGADGSAHFTVHWSQLRDPARLQAALDAASVPVRILVGKVRPGGPAGTIPACAKPYFGGPYDRRAVQWDFPNPTSEVNGVIVRPQYFPAHGTLVIEVHYDAGSTNLADMMSFMAVGTVPTCAVPNGAQPATPTR